MWLQQYCTILYLFRRSQKWPVWLACGHFAKSFSICLCSGLAFSNVSNSIHKGTKCSPIRNTCWAWRRQPTCRRVTCHSVLYDITRSFGVLYLTHLDFISEYFGKSQVPRCPKCFQLQAASCPAFSCWLFQDPRRLAEVAHWAECGMRNGTGSTGSLESLEVRWIVYSANVYKALWLNDDEQTNPDGKILLQKVVRLSDCLHIITSINQSNKLFTHQLWRCNAMQCHVVVQ
jgi:hypothetical protein